MDLTDAQDIQVGDTQVDQVWLNGVKIWDRNE